MFIKKASIISLCIVFSAVVYSSNSMADESGDIIKYRQNVMKGIAADFRMINAILKGKIKNSSDLGPLAASLAAKSKMVKVNFPEGSDFGETDAKEEIWENKADFDSKSDSFAQVTQELLKALNQKADQATVVDKFAAVGKNCKSCHKKYREK